MKGCELCSNRAKIFCDSDQARLCWDCDEKVHGANFLVAKHCRSLLCHVCLTPTPWKSSGPKLGPVLSVCENCFNGCSNISKIGREEEEEETNHPQRTHQEQNQEEESDEIFDSESELDGDEFSSSDDGEYSDEDAEDDGENQVVPWSDCSSSGPPVTSSSGSEAEEEEEAAAAAARGGGGATVAATFNKRMCPSAFLDADDEDGSSLQFRTASVQQCEMQTSSGFRPLKIARTTTELIHQRATEMG